MGNSAYRQGKLKKAVEHFEAALKLSPDDNQAKENLAFVQQQLQQQQQQQQRQNDQKHDRPDDADQPSDTQPGQRQLSGDPQQKQQNTGQSKEDQPPEYGANADGQQPPDSQDPAGEQQQAQQARANPGKSRPIPDQRPPRCSTGSRTNPAGR